MLYMDRTADAPSSRRRAAVPAPMVEVHEVRPEVQNLGAPVRRRAGGARATDRQVRRRAVPRSRGVAGAGWTYFSLALTLMGFRSPAMRTTPTRHRSSPRRHSITVPDADPAACASRRAASVGGPPRRPGARPPAAPRRRPDRAATPRTSAAPPRTSAAPAVPASPVGVDSNKAGARPYLQRPFLAAQRHLRVPRVRDQQAPRRRERERFTAHHN